MDFLGKWKNSETNDLIAISNIARADMFLLNYGSNLTNSEEIEIFLSGPNTNHARLLHSSKFKSKDIFILTSDSFKIDNKVYLRQIEK